MSLITVVQINILFIGLFHFLTLAHSQGSESNLSIPFTPRVQAQMKNKLKCVETTILSNTPISNCTYTKDHKSAQQLVADFNDRVFGNPYNNLRRCENSEFLTFADKSHDYNCGHVSAKNNGKTVNFTFRIKDKAYRDAYASIFKSLMIELDSENSDVDISYTIKVDTFFVSTSESDSFEFSLYGQNLGIIEPSPSRAQIISQDGANPASFTLTGGNLATSFLSARFGNLYMKNHVKKAESWSFSGVKDGEGFHISSKEPISKGETSGTFRSENIELTLYGNISQRIDAPNFIKTRGIGITLSRPSDKTEGLVKTFSNYMRLPDFVPLNTPIFILSETVNLQQEGKESCFFCSKKSDMESKSQYEVYITISKNRDYTDPNKTLTKEELEMISSAPSSVVFEEDMFEFLNSFQIQSQSLTALYESDFAHKLILKSNPQLYKSDFGGHNIFYSFRLLDEDMYEVTSEPYEENYMTLSNLLYFQIPTPRTKDLLKHGLKDDKINFSVEFVFNNKSYTYYLSYYPSLKAIPVVNEDIIRPGEAKPLNFDNNLFWYSQ